MEIKDRVLHRVYNQVKKGLEHMTQDEAADLVKPGYGKDGVLPESIVAQNKLLFASLIRDCGVEDTPALRKVIADQQAVMLTLTHFMYASGIRRGRK